MAAKKNPHRMSMRVCGVSVIIGCYEFRRRRRAIPIKPRRPLPRRSSEEGSGTVTIALNCDALGC